MNRYKEPPATFKCGHARTEENTRFNESYACCRTCYLLWLKEYRQRTNRSAYERERQARNRPQQREAARQRRLRRLLTNGTESKPHLYPNQQVA